MVEGTRTGTDCPLPAPSPGDVVHVVRRLVEADGLEGAKAGVQGHVARPFYEAFVFQTVRIKSAMDTSFMLCLANSINSGNRAMVPSSS